jgi:arsenate reductase
MAEGIARTLAPAGMPVFSAGSDPAVVNPLAVKALAEIGIDISHHESKPIGAIPSDQVRTVVTLCDEENCPLFPGDVERLHWGMPDPAAAEGNEESRLQAFRDVRDELRSRIPELFS